MRAEELAAEIARVDALTEAVRNSPGGPPSAGTIYDHASGWVVWPPRSRTQPWLSGSEEHRQQLAEQERLRDEDWRST